MVITKSYLQGQKGCTRRQAVEFKKSVEYTDEEFAKELERVKREFPEGGKKKKIQIAAVTEVPIT